MCFSDQDAKLTSEHNEIQSKAIELNIHSNKSAETNEKIIADIAQATWDFYKME